MGHARTDRLSRSRIWHGAFAGSAHITDDRCFEPMQGGHYVRDTHQVRGGQGPYGGETIYYLDAQAHRLAFTYYASDGGMSRGFADADGNGLVFPPGTYVDPDGSTLILRGSWRPDGPNRYLAISEIQENGQWRVTRFQHFDPQEGYKVREGEPGGVSLDRNADTLVR